MSLLDAGQPGRAYRSRMRFRIAVGGMLLALVAGSCANPDAAPAASSPTTAVPDSRTLACGGEVAAGFQEIACDDMTFDVGVPDACPKDGCGLIADVHGGGGGCCDGAVADLHTNMQALGTGAGYVVVQPNVPGKTPESEWVHGDHDLRLRALMEQLIDALNLDRNRVQIGGSPTVAG